MRLRFGASLRVVAKHKHMPRIAIEAARDVIRRAAADKNRTHDDQLMVDDLERATGMTIAELAKLTTKWVPGRP